ncbi:MAG: hypothetical protein AAGA56_30710 [Myxococcota bacterium]
MASKGSYRPVEASSGNAAPEPFFARAFATDRPARYGAGSELVLALARHLGHSSAPSSSMAGPSGSGEKPRSL